MIPENPQGNPSGGGSPRPLGATTSTYRTYRPTTSTYWSAPWLRSGRGPGEGGGLDPWVQLAALGVLLAALVAIFSMLVLVVIVILKS